MHLLQSFWCWLWTNFTHFSGTVIANFQHIYLIYWASVDKFEAWFVGCFDYVCSYSSWRNTYGKQQKEHMSNSHGVYSQLGQAFEKQC